MYEEYFSNPINDKKSCITTRVTSLRRTCEAHIVHMCISPEARAYNGAQSARTHTYTHTPENIDRVWCPPCCNRSSQDSQFLERGHVRSGSFPLQVRDGLPDEWLPLNPIYFTPTKMQRCAHSIEMTPYHPMVRVHKGDTCCSPTREVGRWRSVPGMRELG